MVYVENLTSALYLDKQADVDRYLLAMERLSIVAYEPQRDPRILERSSAARAGGATRQTRARRGGRGRDRRSLPLAGSTAVTPCDGRPRALYALLGERQVELAVLGADQERLPLGAGVDMRRLGAVLRVTDRDAAAWQVRDLDAIAGRARAALEPVQVAQVGSICFPPFVISFLLLRGDHPSRHGSVKLLCDLCDQVGGRARCERRGAKPVEGLGRARTSRSFSR